MKDSPFRRIGYALLGMGSGILILTKNFAGGITGALAGLLMFWSDAKKPDNTGESPDSREGSR
ncbi:MULTISPECIES: hypothetical protein [Actinotignum]|uniref:Uncharacterized protein n=1 Tax=Actinotignum timonense TaxID=1870995 RepID=A0AAW9HMZ8_9ACTO|nr:MULTISPECIES: hypothetical protein [Actinotignum]MBS5748501.1 hypothetical protein [Actinotignum schaalii]MDE1557644.1 hypothetical protein [Actinotignum schaalii]MDE1662572.1 hypothetical protein [Actinotignum schaalii]MDK6373363.1 hypothetical protein [Actinotignum timonense]MDK6418102.1 hypothetical protein [Actinotignum timonense]